MKKFLISCGGTGGHLSPGIALAEGLIARGHEACLLISRKKVDGRLSEKYPHLRFERMPGTGFAWNPLQLAKCSLSQSQAVWFCLRLMRSMRPAAVIGFGGFTSAPVVLAARVSGVPCALHESNRVPGRAVRTLGRLAQRVYLPPGIHVPRIRAAAVREMGLPVRREFSRRLAAGARTALGLDADKKLLVVLGGSQGASALNDWARRHVGEFAVDGIQLFVVTGLGKGREETIEFPARAGGTTRAVFAPFSDRMAELISAADLVVSRAGAGTLAELAR
ncbi:MAG: UDP-N-acetylglucosamine--N-acetylmuramyl-(pentapeptide) pyrophosphoryl-undecaprenol N-acetylglucosamine transferase, partial [Opitutaceae bacterium]